eukprot:gb/GECG01008124.1/.p1 GENE.gb/GECG01008124.1/~~gb/GECG01008124.1/.p1  ORF type:complete len:498 (+),score=53.24 gb/GECG01008124.1/:1-1494(+)
MRNHRVSSDMNDKQDVLLALALAYTLLCVAVIFFGAQKGIGTLSHRFHYSQFLLVASFIRGLNFFVGIGVCGQIPSDSWLAFFLFDIGTLLMLVSIIVLIGSQIRNVKAIRALKEIGVLRPSETGRTHGLSLTDRLLTQEDQVDKDGAVAVPKPSTEVHYRKTSLAIFAASSVMVLTYFILAVLLYNLTDTPEQRKDAISFYFVAVNAILAVILALSTQFERMNGCFDVNVNRHHSHQFFWRQTSVNSDRFPSKLYDEDGFASWCTTYAGKQILLSTVLIIFCLYRVIWYAVLLNSGYRSEMEEPYKYLIADYGVEFFFLVLVFLLLHRTAHSCFSSRDPFYMLSIYQKLTSPNIQMHVSEGGWVGVNFGKQQEMPPVKREDRDKSKESSAPETNGFIPEKDGEEAEEYERDDRIVSNSSHISQSQRRELSFAVVQRLMSTMNYMLTDAVQERVDESLNEHLSNFYMRFDDIESEQAGLRYALSPEEHHRNVTLDLK